MKIFNKNTILLVIGIMIFILWHVGVNFIIYKNKSNIEIPNVTQNIQDKNFDTIAIMFEQNDGSYKSTTGSSFNQSGYLFNHVKSNCVDVNGNKVDGILAYNVSAKAVEVTSTKTVYCYVYFDKSMSAPELNALANPQDVAYDGTADNNLRYIGANPNNYIYFNCSDYNNPTASTCEKWRIIGAFNNTRIAASPAKTLFKIVRNESIGNFLYDYKGNGVGSAIGTRRHGSDDWSDSQLMLMLNGKSSNYKSGYTESGDYLLDTNGVSIMNISGSYYDGSSIAYKPRNASLAEGFTSTVTVDFSSTGIKNDTTRRMIEYTLWQLGRGKPDETTSSLYNSERSTKVYSGYSSEWPSYIGLMYPSDYGFATGGGTTTSRATCLSTIVYDWRDSSSDCYNNNWLTPTSREFLITPYGYSPSSSDPVKDMSYSIADDGLLRAWVASTELAVRPTVHLNSSIVINGGTGTLTNPYTIEMS